MTYQEGNEQSVDTARPVESNGSSPPKRSRSAADWEAVERDYRAGAKSIRQIAKEHAITHTAVLKRAEAENWPRDLAGKIRAAANIQLAREVAKGQVSTQVATVSERGIVEANAALQVEIIRSHRSDITRARSVMQGLLDDLGVAASTRETLAATASKITADDKSGQRRSALLKAISIGEQAQTLETLTRSLQRLVALERQAFGIDQMAERTPDDSYEARLRRLLEAGKTVNANSD